jgi:hypothetical protein
MLSFLYLINTSITPFVVATLESFRTGHATFGGMSFLSPSIDGKNRLIYQLWYDTGSIVNQMVINLAVTGVSFCFTNVVSMPSLLKRYGLARGAKSQHKLNQLWMPPPMKVGRNYAKLFKAMSLVLIYAPMYPPMYIFAACYLVPSFFATHFGIAHWFAQPPRMDQTVTESMRGWLAGSLGISLVIKRLMTAEEIYQRAAASIPLYLAVVAWVAYMVIFEVRGAAARRAYPTAAAPHRRPVFKTAAPKRTRPPLPPQHAQHAHASRHHRHRGLPRPSPTKRTWTARRGTARSSRT